MTRNPRRPHREPLDPAQPNLPHVPTEPAVELPHSPQLSLDPAQVVAPVVSRVDSAREDRLHAEYSRAEKGGRTYQYAPPGRPASPLDGLRDQLSSRAALRQAFMLTEVLGPPKALQDDSGDVPGLR